jgi:Protein of unknown function (DUF2490)
MRILFLLLLTTTCLRADEWWAWTNLEYWRAPKTRASLFLGNRADVDDGSYVQIASPRVKHALLPWLEGGIGLSLLSIENTRTGDRVMQFRPELELNPHFDLTKQLALEFRNRLEWRWNEAQTFTTHRSRQRLQLAWTLPHPLGPLTRLFIGNEWLTDLHRLQQIENRLVPLGLTFRLGTQSDLDVFYMITSTRSQDHWQHESVIGTYWRVRF